MIVVQVIVPTFLLVAIGYAAGRLATFDLRTLSNLALYVLTPSLVFSRTYASPLEAALIGRIALYTFFIVGAMFAIALSVSRVLRLPRADAAAFLLSVSLFNAGNMGLPIILFAFGEQGLTYAVVVVVSHVLLTSTVGVFVAANARMGKREALKQVFALPGVYAIALGFFLGHGGVALPEAIRKPVELLGAAAIPVNTAILGVQLSRAARPIGLGVAGVASAMRLLVAPLLGAALLPLLGFSGLAYKVMLLQTSMPSAVYSAILSERFEANEVLAAHAVLLSTLLSALSISVLLLVVAT